MERPVEDPAEWVMLLLERTGVVRELGKPGSKAFYYFMSFFSGSAMTCAIVSMWGQVLEDHPLTEKTLAFEAILSSFYASGKLINMRVRVVEFCQIINDTRSVWREMLKDPANHPILVQERARMLKIFKVLLLVYILPTPMSILGNLLHNLTSPPEEAELIYKIWDPWKHLLGEEWFKTRYIYQAVVFGQGLSLFGVACCSIIYCCLSACIQMRVLCRMLESKELDVDKCVSLHQKNLKCVRDINNLFTGWMLVELLCNALVISLRLYIVIRMIQRADPRAFGEIVFLGTCFSDPYVVCYSGQIIRDMSEAVHRSAYQNEWYRLSTKDRRTLSLFMTYSSRPLQLQYRNLMSFDMVRFSSVAQAAYSYVTVLLKT